MRNKSALLIATTAQSLALQSPLSWDVLRERGYSLHFVAEGDSWAGQLSKWGTFQSIPASRKIFDPRHLATRRELKNAVDRGSWNLIQTQSPIASAILRTLPLPSDTATIYVAHGFHFHRDQTRLRRLAYRLPEQILAGRTDAVAVVAEEDFEDASRFGFEKYTKLWRLPGAGIELAGGENESIIAPTENPFALFVGELIPRKNPILAVRSVAAARELGTEVDLVVVGDGPLRDQVIAAGREYIGGDSFHYIPRTDAVRALMRSAAVQILPSWQEGVPRVVMEAASVGLPTLATSNRGSRELARIGLVHLVPRNATDLELGSLIPAAMQRASGSNAEPILQFYGETSFRHAYNGLLDELKL